MALVASTNVVPHAVNLTGLPVNCTLDWSNIAQINTTQYWDRCGGSSNNTDDAINISKGIDVYSWINAEDLRVEFYVPDRTVTHTDLNGWNSDTVQLESGFWGKDMEFSFSVIDSKNNVLLHRAIVINTRTENIVGGDMTNLEQLKSVITPQYALSYGFYDTVRGSGLSTKDACWVTVVRNNADWMRSLAPPGSPQAAKPFTYLVLPSPHDAGMNSMDTLKPIIAGNKDRILRIILAKMGSVARFAQHILDSLGDWSVDVAEDIVSSIAITQRDSTTTMLAIGARYLGFRAAHLAPAFRFGPDQDELYFHHDIAPGQKFHQFLDEIVRFLATNTDEIVVIDIRSDGVPPECELATLEEVHEYVQAAIEGCSGCVVPGTLKDMNTRTIDELRQSKKRLIVLYRTKDYSTWDKVTYATIDGKSILEKFPTFLANAKAKENTNLTSANWQCQATGTDYHSSIIFLSPVVITCLRAQKLTSVLLATKPVVMRKLLPWVRDNVYPHMPTTLTQLVSDDWFDGADAMVAIQLSAKYLGTSDRILEGSTNSTRPSILPSASVAVS